MIDPNTGTTRNAVGAPLRIPAFEVPQAAVARHPGMLDHPRELQQWLSSLTLADPARISEKLLRHLYLVARDPEPELRHPGLLQAFHPPVCMLQEKIWENFVHNRAARKTENLLLQRVAELLQEMAFPHLQRINLCIANDRPPAAEDLFDALLLLGRLIQWEVLQYQLTPPVIWRQILLLYAISDYFKLTTKPCVSALALDFDPGDIHTQFHALLTLLLADTYRLPHRVLPRLVRGLGQFAGHLRTGPAGSGRYTVPVSFSGKTPPLHFVRQRSGATQASNVLVLDELLKQLGQQVFPGDHSDGLHLGSWLLDSLRGLAALDESPDARRQPRQPRQMNYRLISGLDAIHRRLRVLQGEQYFSTVTADGILVEDQAYMGPPESQHDCQQINHSAGGASFRLPVGVPVPTIGQLVLFEAEKSCAEGRSQGFVAQVRRQQRRDDGSHEIGVEKIRGNLVPVAIGHDRASGLLHADPQLDHLALFAQPGTFALHSRSNLHGPGREYQVRHRALQEGLTLERIQVTLE